MLLMAAVSSYAQNDVTTFLGIPVDGFRQDMIKKLKEKGFVTNFLTDELLDGEFNGQKVSIGILTNNNKVYRIAVSDKNQVSEGEIKIRFNNLCKQFENNPKYIPYKSNQHISDSEDISYEMIVHNKRYDAYFFQDGDDNKIVWLMIASFGSKYYIIIFYDNEYNKANGEDL